MDTKIIKLDNYNINIIKTDSFKSVVIDIRFRNKYIKEEVPLLNFLANMLTFTNKKYSKRDDFVNQEMDLYDLLLNSSFRTEGNFNFLNFRSVLLNEKYTEKDMYAKSIEFISDCIFDPNVEKENFDLESFEIVKRDILNNIATIRENIGRYASVFFFEEVNRDSSYLSILSKEYMDLFNDINTSNLYAFYLNVLKTYDVDVIVMGDVDEKLTEELFKKYFKFSKRENASLDFVKKYKKVNKTSEVFKKDKTLQSKLNIAYTIDDVTPFEKEFVLPIFNLILGGYTNSRFFKNVREKYSLCYHISSSVRNSDNLLLIRSDISKVNYDKVLACIKKEINGMKKTSEIDLKDAITFYKMSCLEGMEEPRDIVDNYYKHLLIGSHLLNEKSAEVEKVSLDDIKNIVNKLHIHTIHLYGGDTK